MAVSLPLGGCARRFVSFSVYRLVSIDVKGVDATGFWVNVTCEVESHSPLDATLTDLQFSTYTGPHLLGEGRLPGPVEVPGGTRLTLVAPVRMDYRRFPADFPRRVSRGVLPLRTEARFLADTALGDVSLQVSSTDQVKVSETLSVAVTGPFRGGALIVTSIEPRRVGLLGMTLRLGLHARNKFAFPINVRRGQWQLRINDRRFGRGQLSRALTIPAGGEADLAVEVAATHGAVGHALLTLLTTDPKFRVTGTLWIDPIGGVSEIPLDMTADASVLSGL